MSTLLLSFFENFFIFFYFFLFFLFLYECPPPGIPETAPPARPGRGSDWSCGAERRKKTGTGRQLGKRKGADAAEGHEERSNEAEAGTPESTTAGSVWNPAVPPVWRKKATPPKKRNGINSDYNFTAGIHSSLLRAIS